MSKLQHMITAAFGDVFKPAPDDDITMSRSEYNDLQDKLDRLQIGADRFSMVDLDTISKCSSVGSAKVLQEDYNSDWFAASPYSLEVLQIIAAKLLDVSEPYLPGNGLWIKASYGDIPNNYAEPAPPPRPTAKPWEKQKLAAEKERQQQEAQPIVNANEKPAS